MRGDIVPMVAAPVAIGSMCGAFLGSKLMLRMSGRWIRYLFIGVLLALAAEMLLTALGSKVAKEMLS